MSWRVEMEANRDLLTITTEHLSPDSSAREDSITKSLSLRAVHHSITNFTTVVTLHACVCVCSLLY